MANKNAYTYQERIPVTRYRQELATVTHNGAIIAQTFIAPRAMILSGVGLFFTKVGATGDVVVLVCDTNDSGKPVMSRVIAKTTVLRSDLKIMDETVVALANKLLEAGRRYAVCLITGGDHYCRTVPGNVYTNGTLFNGTDGDYFTGNVGKDLWFKLYAAAFTKARTEIPLQSVSLANGISDITIKTPAVVPDGTRLGYEAQIAGVWYPIDKNLKLLEGLPDIVPIRAVFLGSADLQPILQLSNNALIASRPATSALAISTVKNLSSGKQNFRIDCLLSQWYAPNHTLVVKMLHGAGGAGYATEATAASVVTVLEDPLGLRKRLRFTFALGVNVTSFKIKATSGRTAETAPFTIQETTWIAVS